jgi:hypothetical protein
VCILYRNKARSKLRGIEPEEIKNTPTHRPHEKLDNLTINEYHLKLIKTDIVISYLVCAI